MSQRKNNNKNQIVISVIALIVFVILSYLYSSFYDEDGNTAEANNESWNVTSNYTLSDIPEYSGELFIKINNNEPYFNESEYTTEVFEKYSDLDEKGRCGVAYANICRELMPKAGQTRKSISNVKPSGWKQTKIDGEFLYNRCHLIAYQLADENANEKNLITGTNYFNTEGMLPFENQVASYIKNNSNNHVLYRVTPDFRGDNLVANGVEIEAYSVEDNGKGVKFNVYIYNIKEGVSINYLNGEATN